MPYILSPLIKENMSGMWMEGAPYSRSNLHSIDGSAPPVNYDTHHIKSHSLTHIESPRHTQKNGKAVDEYFHGDNFYGPCTVLRLKGDNYKKINDEISHWEINLDELRFALKDSKPKKILITVDNYIKNLDGFHDPNYVLTLSKEAAEYLISIEGFNLYGTSWKSSDFNPGALNRPIHNTLFRTAIILENLDLEFVPEGEYFLNAFPLRIEGASESPVTPVLFKYDEINNRF